MSETLIELAKKGIDSKDLEEHVSLIHKIARTGTDKAITYLESLLVSESEDTVSRTGSLHEFIWSDWMDTGQKVGVESYPHAPKSLKEALIHDQTYSSHFDVDDIYGVEIKRTPEEMLTRKYKDDDTYWAPLNLYIVNGPRPLRDFIKRCIDYCKSIKSFGFVKEVKRQT